MFLIVDTFCYCVCVCTVLALVNKLLIKWENGKFTFDAYEGPLLLCLVDVLICQMR